VRAGAPAISWPHHKGESLNLTIDERKLFAEAAVKVVAGGCRLHHDKRADTQVN
jgi:dihydrodipicolinate synthase/N-acetylneuraminate lyase